jgi:hypothetical protein
MAKMLKFSGWPPFNWSTWMRSRELKIALVFSGIIAAACFGAAAVAARLL